MPLYNLSVQFQDIHAADRDEAAALFCGILASACWDAQGGLAVHVEGDDGEAGIVMVPDSIVTPALADARPLTVAPDTAPADPVKADMLAALKAIKAARDMPHYGDTDAALDHFHDAMPAVEAAIARAEGRV